MRDRIAGEEGVISDVMIKQNLGVVLTLAYSTRLGQVLGVPPDTKIVKDTPRIGAYTGFLVTSVPYSYYTRKNNLVRRQTAAYTRI